MDEQIVVIEDEYGVFIYPRISERVLLFELRQFHDEYPDKYQLREFRAQIDKVTNSEAKEWLERWYSENYRDWDAEEREAQERLAQEEKDEDQEAIKRLESKGYRVI